LFLGIYLYWPTEKKSVNEQKAIRTLLEFKFKKANEFKQECKSHFKFNTLICPILKPDVTKQLRPGNFNLVHSYELFIPENENF